VRFHTGTWNSTDKTRPKTFPTATRHDATRLKEALPLQYRVYSEQIRKYKRYFNNDQLLFVKYDDFRNNQNSELNKTFHLLNIRKWLTEYKPEVIHKRPYHKQMQESEKELLQNIYRNDIKETEQLLGGNRDDWIQ